MASGVATTRLQELHFIKLTRLKLWASAKKLSTLFISFGDKLTEMGVTGIRKMCCGNFRIPSWMTCSWHSLAKVCQPQTVLLRYRKASRGEALANTSARWCVVQIFSTKTFLSSTHWRKWCDWTAKCLVLGRSLWMFASSRAPTLSSKT